MADNITLDAGSGGSVVRSDDDGSAHWQYVKMAYGADNTQNIVTSTTTNPFPVALSDTDNAVLDSIQTAVEVIDDTVAVLGTATYTETTTKGTVMGAVRNDTLSALAGTPNEIAPLQVNASGALYTEISGGVINALADGAAWEVDVTEGLGIVGLYEASPTTLTSDDVGFIGLTATREVRTTPMPQTTGGLSAFNDNDLDETAVVVKAAAGQVYSIHCINLDATPVYLQLFNVAQGSVAVGTTPPTMEFVVPSQGDANGAGFTIYFQHGIAFSTAITAAATTNSEGNGAPGANEVHVVIGYK